MKRLLALFKRFLENLENFAFKHSQQRSEIQTEHSNTWTVEFPRWLVWEDQELEQVQVQVVCHQEWLQQWVAWSKTLMVMKVKMQEQMLDWLRFSNLPIILLSFLFVNV